MSEGFCGDACDEQLDEPASRELVASAKGVLIDWDGCLALGDRPSDDAVEFLKRHSDRAAIVSNNSTNLPHDISQILEERGVRLHPARIVLAGAEAINRALEAAPQETQILGDRRMRAHARNHGLALVREGGSLVVLLRDPQFSYTRLERAANALRRGARLIVSNPDLTHPGRRGAIVPETGSLLAALASCVDLSTLDVEIIGKPSPRLFELACAAVGVEPSQAVMIGDNPQTDMAGARAAGMKAIRFRPRAGGFFGGLL
jgi:4-nitrophenyl phosphatase